MTLISLPIMIFAVPVFIAEPSSLLYFNPQGDDRTPLNYATKGLSSIPRELGEKVLMSEGSLRVHADTIVVVLDKEYASIQKELRKLVEEKIGIRHEHDTLSGHISDPEKEPSPYDDTIEYPAWPPLGDGLDRFRHTARQFAPPREYQLTSHPYNRIESIEGYSRLRIRVTDAQELLGKGLTIVQIRRRDFSKERARLHHALPIPLPYREIHAVSLVTDTEVALIEQLKQRLPGLSISYFLPGLGSTFEEREELWASFEQAVKRFKQENGSRLEKENTDRLNF